MKRLVTFGCSNTWGQGLDNPKEEVWGAVLANYLGRDFINEGRQGASNKYIAHAVEQFDFLPNDLVIISWTFLDRFSILYDPKKFGKDNNNNARFVKDIHYSQDTEISNTYYHLFYDDYDCRFTNTVLMDYTIDLLIDKELEFRQLFWNRDECPNNRHMYTEKFPFYFYPYYDNYPSSSEDDPHMGPEGNKALGHAMFQKLTKERPI